MSAAGARAAFLGMPFDSTTIARPGAQLGPRAVRDWSSHMLSYHGEYDLDIFEALGVADMGDVAVVPAVDPALAEELPAGRVPDRGRRLLHRRLLGLRPRLGRRRRGARPRRLGRDQTA